MILGPILGTGSHHGLSPVFALMCDQSCCQADALQGEKPPGNPQQQ